MLQVPSALPAPWYRQFWPWFLMAIPAASVVAGIVMITVAASHRDTLVTDDYYRVGISINVELAELDRAMSLGVVADIDPVKDDLLTLGLSAQVAVSELNLEFRHPTLAGRDFAVSLHRQEDGRYAGLIEQHLGGRWQVVLTPADQPDGDRWRLEGTWRNPVEEGVTLGIVHE